MFSFMEHATTLQSDVAPNVMHSLMRYKRWADADLLERVLALPALSTAPEGPIVTAIIRHYHTVDCIFRAHLLGVPHDFTSANPPEPATLSELQQRVSAIDDWYLEYTRSLERRDFGEVLHVKFTDGQEQLMSRSDVLLHVSLHGTYHRGNVGLLLRKCGAEPPPDRFTSYLRATHVR
jgi:uncharacterized damage-inducible protein DinB